MRTLALFFLFGSFAHAQLLPNGTTASFRGSLPPSPTAELSPDQQKAIETRLAKITADFDQVKNHRSAADVEIFLKAVRYAIEFHEWYDKKSEDGVKKANVLLDEAASRLEGLKNDKTPWLNRTGSIVLGFYSKIDGSAQPYGVEIPEGLDYGKGKPSIPMWVWLHGRGDTSTDLHFVYGRLTAKKPGQFQPVNSIVIHPFGRYCNGWKSAGETDVFEARDDAMARFNVDTNRIALAGFSMGGAGAWHIGAHFADQWAAVHAGAGFVDVKRYQKLTPDKYPVWYEQSLWGAYDVPNYARNFLNVPLIAYSGENDPQRDAAEYMMENLAIEGLKPPHFIGPGMGHKYHPEVIKEVQASIEAAVKKGRIHEPIELHFQTRTLAYSRLYWLQIQALQRHWEDARVDAKWDKATNGMDLQTKNVDSLILHLASLPKVTINGAPATFARSNNHPDAWEWKRSGSQLSQNHKQPGLQGPIDDAFRSKFLVVLPDRSNLDSSVDRWVKIEAEHFLKRWRSLMRGDVQFRLASEVTSQDIRDCHLILWGTPKSNSKIEEFFYSKELDGSISWNDTQIKMGKLELPNQDSVLVLTYPNPLNTNRYVVLNSGLTFREAHDRTNSLQNPKLPDWAVLDVTQPANSESAGNVIEADFFDENWQPIDRTESTSKRP
jgi:Prolyl oligopeptidase family